MTSLGSWSHSRSPYNIITLWSRAVMRKKEKIYQLRDYYSIQYQILRTNIIRIVLQMRRVNVNRPLFTRSSSSCFPIHLSICSFVADTVSMNVGPVLFFSSFCDIVFSSMVFFGAVDMHVAVANKTNNNIEMTVWNCSYLYTNFVFVEWCGICIQLHWLI